MEVVLSSNMGFCKGVSLSLDKVREAYALSIKEGLPCYIYGDIVHNSQVMREIFSHGIVSISSSEGHAPGVVVIRAHGITDEARESFIADGFILIDATCPVVLKNQSIVRCSEREVVVLGHPHHAEVSALMGSSKRGVLSVSHPAELDKLDPSIEYDAVVQTTFSESSIDAIMARAAEIGLRLNLRNTICNASQKRRDAIRELARKVGCILVVGDRKSSNSNELVTLARESGCQGFLIEKAEDIPIDVLNYKSVGVTAGASTPSFLYEEVVEYLRSR